MSSPKEIASPFERQRRAAEKRLELFEQRIVECRDQLNQIGLTIGAGLLVGLVEVGSNCGVRDPKSLCDLGNAADFNDCQQHSQLHWRELLDEHISSLVRKGLELEIQEAMGVLEVIQNDPARLTKFESEEEQETALKFFESLKAILERRAPQNQDEE